MQKDTPAQSKSVRMWFDFVEWLDVRFPATETFEYQSHGVEPLMASGAGCMTAMTFEQLCQCLITEGSLVLRQFRNIRRWRRDVFSQKSSSDPIPAFDGTGT